MGLSSAIDVLPVADQFGQNRFFVLEFSTNMLANAPGRLSLYAQPDGAPVVLVNNLVSPTSLARDEATGDLFVTEIFAGRITRVQCSINAAWTCGRKFQMTNKSNVAIRAAMVISLIGNSFNSLQPFEC